MFSLYDYIQLHSFQSNKLNVDLSASSTCIKGSGTAKSYAVRATRDIPAFACVYREKPFVTVSPLQYSATYTQFWLHEPLPNGTMLHPLMQMVYFLTLEHPGHASAEVFRLFTSAFPGQCTFRHLHSAQQLAKALFITLAQYEYQFQWLFAKLCEKRKQKRSDLHQLLRLVIQWTLPVHTIFTDQRLGYVFCDIMATGIRRVCRPNCFVTCTPEDDWQVQVYSLRPLAVGEELTVSFIPGTQYNQTLVATATELHQWYQFECTCSQCTVPNTDTLSSMLQTVPMNKVDTDFLLGLSERCTTQKHKYVFAANAEERTQCGTLLLRYHWEFVKMLFGRSRTGTEWSLENIEPYAECAYQAVESAVQTMFELPVTNLREMMTRENLIPMLTLFLQIKTPDAIPWITATKIYFLLLELYCADDDDSNNNNKSLVQMRWCWSLELYFLESYTDVNLNLIQQSIATETIHWQFLENTIQHQRYYKLLEIFKLWKITKTLLQQYWIEDLK